MNREALQNGLSKVAWAYILILLDINLNIGRNTLDLLPDWVGYLLLLSAIPLLAPALRDLPLLRPFCVVLAAAEAVEWTAALLTGQSLLYRFLPVKALLTCLAMYVTFQLLTDLARLAEQEGLPAGRLRLCRDPNVVIRAVLFLPLPWEEWMALAVALVVTGGIVCVMIAVQLFALRRRLGEAPA